MIRSTRKIIHTALFLGALSLSVSVAQSAFAACASPVGNEGEMIYNDDFNVMQYCTGTDWISMAGGASIASEADPQVGVTTSNKWCRGDGTAIQCDQNAPGGGTPGGADTQVQFNDGGAFGGDPDFVWNKTTNRLGIGNTPSTELEVTGTVKASGPFWSAFGSTTTLRNLLLENFDSTSVANGSDIGIKLGGTEFQGISWVKEAAWNAGSAAGAKDTMLQFGVLLDNVPSIPMVVRADGKVGIGATSPGATLDVRGTKAVSTSGPMNITDTTSAGLGVGGGIMLFGNFTGTTPTIAAGLDAFKETATAGQFGYSLRFLTRKDGSGALTEAMRINGDGNVGVGTSSPAATAALDITSTNKGFLPPRMTTTERNAIVSPAAGLMIYNTTNAIFEFYTGSAWTAVGGGIPAGTIAAFASACPSGWTEYVAARGRFLRGIDNGAGVDPAGTRVPGNQQADAIQGHIHSTANLNGTTVNGWNLTGGGGAFFTGPSTYNSGGPATDGTNGTPRTAAETRPANVAVTFCQYNGTSVATGVTTLAGLTDVGISSPTNGQVLKYNTTTSKWENGTDIGGSSALSAITAATSTPTALANSTFSQTWNWALTGATADAFTFGETTAATGGTPGDQSVLKATTLASSTATPLIVTNLGNGPSFEVNDETGDGDTTPFIIDASGNVGIGTASPSVPLHVVGGVRSTSYFTVANPWNSVLMNSNGVAVGNNAAASYAFAGSADASSPDTYITRSAAASIQLGAADAASPVAQKLGVQNVVAGTANTAGVNFTIAGSQGTGTGAGGSILFRTAPAGSTGSTQNALATAMTILGNGNVGIGSTNPDYKLRLQTTAGDIAAFTGTTLNAAGVGIYAGSTNNNWRGIDIGTNGSLPISRIAMQYTGSGSYLAFGTSNNYANGITNQAMTIDPSGNVGIGTTNPVRNLHISSPASEAAIVLSRADGLANNKNWRIFTYNSGAGTASALTFDLMNDAGSAVTANGMNLWANGTTSIGTYTAPSGNQKLAVGYGGITLLGDSSGTEGGELSFQSAPGYNGYSIDLLGNDPRMFSVDTVGHTFTIANYGTGVFNLSVEGTVTSALGPNPAGNTMCYATGTNVYGYCSSDLRLKKDIEPIDTPMLDAVVKLQPVTFKWISKDDKLYAGFIAQEVEKVIPLAARKNPDGHYGLDSTAIEAYLVGAIKELKAENDAQSTEIKELRDELKAMRTEIDALKAAK
ncbi:MAG: hypothetical protein EBQ96_09180 [Proteobacteria bacterium]|nr:hypothetical protein [Pseudomonadota bacterium]